MAFLAASSNSVNPSSSALRLTNGASDWLWAAFAIFALSDLGVIFWLHRSTRGLRLRHQLSVIVLTTSAITYYALASNLGRTGVTSEFDSHLTRDIFWVRYIQWFINAPILVLILLLSSGTAPSEYILPAFLSWVAVVSGLVGALTPTRYKWGFFVFGTAALLYLAWHLHTHTRAAASAARPLGAGHASEPTSTSTATAHTTTTATSGVAPAAAPHANQTLPTAYLAALWLIYPLAWGLNEGSSTVGVAGEAIWYGVLDLLSGPVFLFWVLSRARGGGGALGGGSARFGRRGRTGVDDRDEKRAPGEGAVGV